MPTAEGARSAPNPTGVAVVVADNEIDAATAPQLLLHLVEHLDCRDCTVLVVDLAEVRFFGAAGVSVLVAARERAQRNGLVLRLVVASRMVKRVLEVTGEAQAFIMYPSRESAVSAEDPSMG